MDHILAHETYAVERYLLREMTPEEIDEFEEHYFCCRVCGENILAASAFVENTQAVFHDQSVRRWPLVDQIRTKLNWLKRNWRRSLRLPVMIPSVAAVALAVVVSYQNIAVIPELQALRPMGSPVILDGETRATMLPKLQQGEPLRFQMVIVRFTAGDQVRVDLLNAQGKILRSGLVPTPEIDAPLDVYFPGQLEPGRYSLAARGIQAADGGQEMARSQFDITPKEK